MSDLADIVRAVGPSYLWRYRDRMPASHFKVLRDVAACRTQALGGQMYLCSRCERFHPAYHSCRNRHCPQCQGDRARLWLDRQSALLLPCAYGLATCTLPSGLRGVARSHQRQVYSMMLQEAAGALQDLARERRFIGGMPGVMTVLHTWGRSLIYHPHVHLLFTAGGLAGGRTWVKPKRRGYILPGYGLARRFRERMEAAFVRAGLADLVPPSVWRRRWVANVTAVGNGESALRYLSRYVFRVAISNDRIEAFDGERVTIRCKGSGDRVTLEADEFLRRFLQHVLPRGFVKVRYTGLWASAKRDRLELARRILENQLAAEGRIVNRRSVADTGDTAPYRPRCPFCGAVYESPPTRIPRQRGPP